MEKVCTTCGKSSKLIIVPGKEKIYICTDCLDSLKSCKVQSEIWCKSELDPNNSICSVCLSNSPSYINITEVPFRHYCYGCTAEITKTGSKMFINSRWQKLVKSPNDLPKRELLKENLNTVKLGFKDLLNQVDKVKEYLNYQKKGMILDIEDYFKAKLKEIDSYKEELEKTLKSIYTEAKNDIFKGRYHTSRSKGSELLRSARARSLLFSKKLIEFILNKEDFAKALKNILSYTCTPMKNIIEDSSLPLFHPRANCIFEVYPDTLSFEEIKLNLPETPWKFSAAWCLLDDSEYMYTGGDVKNKVSSDAYLITIDKKINPIGKCHPKKNHFLIYLEGITYSFGGNNDICERYIKFTDSWEKIATPPESLGACSATPFKGKIMIACFKRKDLFLYDPVLNKYEKFSPGNFIANCSKLVLGKENILFILQKQKVFRCDGDLKVWKEVGKGISEGVDWHSMCTPFYLDSNIYFLLDDYSLNCFSLKDYTVQNLEIKNN